MPYKLEKSDGGYFVVDDKGKRYSNHPLTHWKARAQLRVLNEAEEKKEMGEMDPWLEEWKDYASKS